MLVLAKNKMGNETSLQHSITRRRHLIKTGSQQQRKMSKANSSSIIKNFYHGDSTERSVISLLANFHSNTQKINLVNFVAAIGVHLKIQIYSFVNDKMK